MPVIDSHYRPPFLLANGYVQSILPTLVRHIDCSHFQRERLDTHDGDFLDLDWSRTQNGSDSSSGSGSDIEYAGKTLLIISHGLEGHSRRPYVAGIVREANNKGWDALAWNFRSCSGEMNKTLRFYHSGATDDLQHVVEHAHKLGYQSIHLVGFSMGGNLSLLYVGRQGRAIPQYVKSVCAFSVPCDLSASARRLAERKNKIFMWRFLKDLRVKVEAKALDFPEQVSAEGYEEIKTFQHFDDRYTAPIHGFDDADDYWTQSSCKTVLTDIRIPALLVNAKNDPFLPAECFPYDEAMQSEWFSLEVPSSGGHVGFIEFNSDQSYWMEKRAIDFVERLVL
ncbi:alpha/beta hydrolase [Oleispira antarctica]|uniref:Alpha/beta hydrolase n=1 Tax=Oleispira antarctica TaxID=188908 RepID=A0A1Y5HFA5_OLEAN|nr:alpha/beta hydrolase [Oleispira antarctica]